MSSETARNAKAQVSKLAKGAMTEKHIYALLAYEDRPGVREKFDKQFGAGAADRVLSEVNGPQTGLTLNVQADIEAVQAALAGAVSHVEDSFRQVAGDVETKISEVSARNDSLTERIDGVSSDVSEVSDRVQSLEDMAKALTDGIAALADTNAKDLSGVKEALTQIAQDMAKQLGTVTGEFEAIKQIAAASVDKIRTLEMEVAKKPKAKPEPKAERKPIQLRVTQRDINDNIIAVEVI